MTIDPPFKKYELPLPTEAEEPAPVTDTGVTSETANNKTSRPLVSVSLKTKVKAAVAPSSKKVMQDLAKWGAIQKEEEANEELFSFLFHAFQLLDTKDLGAANFHLLFLIHYSRFLGIFPVDLDSKADISRFADMQIFSNLPGDTGRIFFEMLKTPLSQAEKIVLNKAGRLILLDVLVKYYEEHLEGMGRIKSVAILKEIFGD
jgi:hypothetical protein